MRPKLLVRDVPKEVFAHFCLEYGNAKQIKENVFAGTWPSSKTWSFLTGKFAGTVAMLHVHENGSFTYYEFKLFAAPTRTGLLLKMKNDDFHCRVQAEVGKADGPSNFRWEYPMGDSWYPMDPLLYLMHEIQTVAHERLKDANFLLPSITAKAA